MSPNYPNPFKNSTTIPYALPEPTAVELKVYDLTGRCVEQLVDGVQMAGLHRVDWRPDGLPAGMYIARLRAGAVTRTINMIRVG